MFIEQISFYLRPFNLHWKGKGGLCVKYWGTALFLLLQKTWKPDLSKMMWRKAYSYIFNRSVKAIWFDYFGIFKFLCTVDANVLFLKLKQCRIQRSTDLTLALNSICFKQMCTVVLKLAVKLQILTIHWFIDIIKSICIMHLLVMSSIFHANK